MAKLARLHRRLGTTTVYVTHDQTEAMTLGQRVAVLRNGVLQQCDTPRRLFERPTNLFVAAFIGSPSMNLIEVAIADGVVVLGNHRLDLHPDHRMATSTRPRVLGIRPSDFVVAEASTPQHWPRLRVQVDTSEDLGAEHHLMFRVAAPPAITDVTKDAADGDDQAPLLRDDGGSVMTARMNGPQRTSIGDTVTLAVNNAAFHLFDLESGEVLASPVASRAPPAAGAISAAHDAVASRGPGCHEV